ncbi:hypothetical protein Goari_005834, partial [Gossypium aridum]|nr:hypothetical protein [Gossypium aridum]
DWKEKGVVIPVKDQNQCVERISKIVTDDLISLSEQELVDCDTLYNEGCNRGLMDCAFQFFIKNGGINTEEDYPYRAFENLDHGVVIVGYDTENSMDYWIVRNSWGSNWAENVYIRIEINVVAHSNGKCSIAIWRHTPSRKDRTSLNQRSLHLHLSSPRQFVMNTTHAMLEALAIACMP